MAKTPQERLDDAMNRFPIEGAFVIIPLLRQFAAELAALQRRLEAPVEEVEKYVHVAANFGEVVPADYARDLHRRLTEANESAVSAYKTSHEWQERAESAEQRARDAQKDVERMDFLEAELERERTRTTDDSKALFRRNLPITRAAIDAAKAAEGGK